MSPSSFVLNKLFKTIIDLSPHCLKRKLRPKDRMELNLAISNQQGAQKAKLLTWMKSMFAEPKVVGSWVPQEVPRFSDSLLPRRSGSLQAPE